MTTFKFNWTNSPSSLVFPPFIGITVGTLSTYIFVTFFREQKVILFSGIILVGIVAAVVTLFLADKAYRKAKPRFISYLETAYPGFQVDNREIRQLLFGQALTLTINGEEKKYMVLSNNKEAVLSEVNVISEKPVNRPNKFITKKEFTGPTPMSA